jgi:hypothetical protein
MLRSTYLRFAALTFVATPLCGQAPSVVPSNIPGNLPSFPEFRIPEAVPLSPGERQVLDRMIEAAEEYVRRNPIYAPQLVRFRDVRDSDRMRRADLSDLDGDGVPDVYDLDGDGVPDPDPLYPRWLTLSDEYLQLPSGLRLDVWVPPGGVRPGSDDILPPNTLLVHSRQLDGDMPWCDPSLHCYFRAHGVS